jgi:hypothetical protein
MDFRWIFGIECGKKVCHPVVMIALVLKRGPKKGMSKLEM